MASRPANHLRKEKGMKNTLRVLLVLLFALGLSLAAQKEELTFHAYVDSDLCARLMLGPINSARVDCSQKTHKEGSEPVLVRLRDDTVLNVNKEKMIDKHVGMLAQVAGETKLGSENIKLKSVTPEEKSSIPAGDPAHKLLDIRTFKTSGDKTFEKVRHTLAMMPYLSVYDFISFAMTNDTVILTGWTVRNINRYEAYNRVKEIEGVNKIINNINVLPLGSNDMQIRAGARARLQQWLSRYFWGSGSDIKIIVKNGDIILLGSVATKQDSEAAYIQCNTVPFAFHVFNMLRIQPGT
jgi:hyperosmotically inducible protein